MHVRSFLKVQPHFRSQTSRALRPIATAFSVASRSTILLRVMFFSSSTVPMIESLCASRREPPRRPCFAGVNRPARALAIQQWLLKCQFQIGPPLIAPTCLRVTQPERG